jgi:hypothetical protein
VFSECAESHRMVMGRELMRTECVLIKGAAHTHTHTDTDICRHGCGPLNRESTYQQT